MGDVIMELQHLGRDYVVTSEGWFIVGDHGVLEEIKAPHNPYELEKTEVKDG
jgi:hypothetical protein